MKKTNILKSQGHITSIIYTHNNNSIASEILQSKIWEDRLYANLTTISSK